MEEQDIEVEAASGAGDNGFLSIYLSESLQLMSHGTSRRSDIWIISVAPKAENNIRIKVFV